MKGCERVSDTLFRDLSSKTLRKVDISNTPVKRQNLLCEYRFPHLYQTSGVVCTSDHPTFYLSFFLRRHSFQDDEASFWLALASELSQKTRCFLHDEGDFKNINARFHATKATEEAVSAMMQLAELLPQEQKDQVHYHVHILLDCSPNPLAVKALAELSTKGGAVGVKSKE